MYHISTQYTFFVSLITVFTYESCYTASIGHKAVFGKNESRSAIKYRYRYLLESAPCAVLKLLSTSQHTVGPNNKNPPKMTFIKFVKLTGYTYLCLLQFHKFWIWSACTNRKRKSSEFVETCLTKYVKSHQVILLLAGFSYLELLCSTAVYDFSGTYQKRQKHQSYGTGVLNVAAASVDSAGVASVRAFYDSWTNFHVM